MSLYVTHSQLYPDNLHFFQPAPRVVATPSSELAPGIPNRRIVSPVRSRVAAVLAVSPSPAQWHDKSSWAHNESSLQSPPRMHATSPPRAGTPPSTLASHYPPIATLVAYTTAAIEVEESRRRMTLQVDESIALSAIINVLQGAKVQYEQRLAVAASRALAAERVAVAKNRASQNGISVAKDATDASNVTRSAAWSAYKEVARSLGTHTPTRHGPAGHSVLTVEARKHRASDHHTVKHFEPTRDRLTTNQALPFDKPLIDCEQLGQLGNNTPLSLLVSYGANSEIVAVLLLEQWQTAAASTAVAHAAALVTVARELAACFYHEMLVREDVVRRVLLEHRKSQANHSQPRKPSSPPRDGASRSAMINDSADEVASMKRALKRAEDDVVCLQTALKHAKEHSAETERAKLTIETSVKDRLHENDSLKRQLHLLQSSHHATQRALHDSEAELMKLRRKRSSMSTGRESLERPDVDAEQQSPNEVKTEVATLRQHVADLEVKLTLAQDSVSEHHRASSDLRAAGKNVGSEMDAAAARLQEVQQRLDAALSHGQDLEITVARTTRELQSVEAERNEVQRSLAATSTTLERTQHNHQRAVAALEGQLKSAQRQAQLSPRSLTPSAGDASHYERELTMVRANAEQQERNAESATADAHSANRRVTDVQSVLANERTEAARRIADLEAAVKRAEAEVVACQGRQIELEDLAEAVIVDCERIEQENDALRDRVKESERYLASVASSASVPNSPLGESASRIAMSASVAEAVKTATATMAEDLAKARRRQTEQRAALREALELASQLKIDINAAHATTRDTGGSLGNPQIARVVAAHLGAVDAWAVRYGKHLS
jgi:hypothetical protein